MLNIFEFIIVSIYGLCIGSFLNVVIYRIGKAKETIIGRSACPKCKNKLKWYHNIPLFSWLFLRGKCGFCKEKISIQYPLIELLTMLLGMMVYYLNGLSYHSFFIFATFTTLLAISVIDFKYKMIPDSLSLLALIFACFHSNMYFDSIKYAFIMIGFFTLLRISGQYFFNKEIMGEGDLLIAGIIGAMLPTFEQAMTSIMVTCIVIIIPSIYLRLNQKENNLIKDERFNGINNSFDLIKNKDKEDVIYQQKILILEEGLKDLSYIDSNPSSLPFIPFLTIGLFITYFFNLNFYSF